MNHAEGLVLLVPIPILLDNWINDINILFMGAICCGSSKWLIGCMVDRVIGRYLTPLLVG
jgi:hypothetical protein